MIYGNTLSTQPKNIVLYYSNKLKPVMDEERLYHVIGMAYTAANLSFVYNVPTDTALIAGMLHDCAKCIPFDKQVEICEKNNIPITESERINQKLLHAKVGAFLAETKYKIKDKQILNAIKYHTTGKPNMNMLEKIIFVADYIEPNKHKNPSTVFETIRKDAYKDIDKAVAGILLNTPEYMDNMDSKDNIRKKTYDYYCK